MKKVLALVLALTMVLGFAATASASYYPNRNSDGYVTRDLFNNNDAEPSFTVGSFSYEKGMYVDGNTEYTIKAEFDTNDLANYLGIVDTTWDTFLKEWDVYETIRAYANDGRFNNGNEEWNWSDFGSNAGHLASTNPMVQDICDIYGVANTYANARASSNIFTILTNAMTNVGDFEDGYTSTAFRRAANDLENQWRTYNSTNGFWGYDKGIAAIVTSKDGTYATVTSQPVVTVDETATPGVFDYTVEFKVRFTNTTFRSADVDIEVLLQSGSMTDHIYYEDKNTLSFTVLQAQYRTFTEQDALIAFGVTPNVEISADDYAYISADAFRLMLQNSSRSITVVSGMGDSKVRFDKDSTNLPQDVFVGNFTTSANSDSVSINGFSSTTSAKIKIAVGRSFYNANNGKVISVYDANGNKLDVEATLQGDYTVNFYAPLSNYTVAGTDWAGQTVPSTDAGKNNPSMGGAF